VTTVFTVLGAVPFLFELVGQLLGELLGMVLGPVFRPIGRLAGRLLNRWTVRLLWIGSLASFGFWPYSVNAESVVIQTLGFVAFMGLTPLALMGTFSLRARGRAEQARHAALQPRPEPVWHPDSRVVRRSMEAADAG
jgi:hypothetical protein